MSWFADLAGKAENLLNNLDEQAGAALRSHDASNQKKHDNQEHSHSSDPLWSTKKKAIPRSIKTVTKKNNPLERRDSPIRQRCSTTNPTNNKSKQKPPVRKLYNLNNCPKTLVGDIKDVDHLDMYGYKPRRSSLPSDLKVFTDQSFTVRTENLEIENAMLKNELNVTSKEIKELVERLHHTEEGERVVNSSAQELSKSNDKLEHARFMYGQVNEDKHSLSNQLEHLKTEVTKLTNVDLPKWKEQKRQLDTEILSLREKNRELETLVTRLTENTKEKDSNCLRAETDLRHAHSTINVLQSDLEKSNAECKRLEKEWESYKYRVKSMLAAKDKEIRAIQQGVTFSEDTKILMKQIEQLKEEREVLSEAVTRVRGECEDLKQYMGNLENRHKSAERVVGALRDALKDERAARTRAESQCNSLCKELKSVQIESSQTIASLRTALRDKDQELSHIRESSSIVLANSDSSALNVADYDVTVVQDSDESAQERLLTQKLIQKQTKIDTLLADNNMLKIQLGKLEAKQKSESQSRRMNSHSVVHLQELDRNRTRGGNANNAWCVSRLSWWMGGVLRRYPLFRLFMIIYMICLHLWVLTVLLTSTPETFNRYKPVLNPQI